LVLDAGRPLKVFYDIDTPVTLMALEQHGIATKGGAEYLTAEVMPEFDLYLSFTGGPTLEALERRWGVRMAKPLYCSVDPEIHFPVPPVAAYRCALSYLGTYSADRQPSLERLLFGPAAQRPDQRFLVAGSQYPEGIAWPANVRLLEHLPPGDHSAFYCSSRVALNITRQAMLRTGYAPSVRLFEAASCGVPVVSDAWPGLEEFFEPGIEILVATGPADVLAALDRSDATLAAIGGAARERALAEHTCTVRARQLIEACDAAAAGNRAVLAS
jgi:spore maturation protein CgeB